MEPIYTLLRKFTKDKTNITQELLQYITTTSTTLSRLLPKYEIEWLIPQTGFHSIDYSEVAVSWSKAETNKSVIAIEYEGSILNNS